MTPDALVGLLAEPTRMRVFAAVVLGASTPADVVRQTALTPREVGSAVRRLANGGLVETVDGALTARVDVFKDAMKERAPRAVQPLDEDRARAAILRTFVHDGRLTAIPTSQSKRRVILEHIVSMFEPGVRYPEREVNAILRSWHPDHAALRRYLVDSDLMARDKGVYWRIGGPVLP